MDPDTAAPFPGNGEPRSPEEIEREIAGTRAALETTVEELGERLRPAQIAEDARSYVREKATRGASDAWRNVRETLQANPLAFALLGGGLVALVTLRHAQNGHHEIWQRRSRRRLADDFLDGPRVSRLASWMSDAGGRANEVGSQAAERVLALTNELRESAAGTRAQQEAARMQSELEALTRERPLLAGVASFALGAFLGALPTPRREG
jgi:ElaB/YqjD/DUF883 family membrane-anchored ribosome-binding protein